VRSLIKLSLLIFAVLVSMSCGKKEDKPNTVNTNPGEFSWSENVYVNNIPVYPLKGKIYGKDINFEYVNFEVWRGSNDNVINFGSRAPKQKCGYIENDNAFHLSRLGGMFEEGDFVKESFGKNIDGFIADFHITVDNNTKKISVPWNCALVITDINEDVVKGRIAMCFKDDAKSWIAGTFTALRCFN